MKYRFYSKFYFTCLKDGLLFSGEESDGQDDIRIRSTERHISVSSETDFPLGTDIVAEESLEQSPTVSVVLNVC